MNSVAPTVIVVPRPHPVATPLMKSGKSSRSQGSTAIVQHQPDAGRSRHPPCCRASRTFRAPCRSCARQAPGIRSARRGSLPGSRTLPEGRSRRSANTPSQIADQYGYVELIFRSWMIAAVSSSWPVLRARDIRSAPRRFYASSDSSPDCQENARSRSRSIACSRVTIASRSWRCRSELAARTAARSRACPGQLPSH